MDCPCLERGACPMDRMPAALDRINGRLAALERPAPAQGQPPCTRADCEHHWSRDPPGQVHCEHEYGSPFCKYRPKQAQPRSVGDLFVAHIQQHLEPGQVVICKICGKSVDEIAAAQPREGGR